MLAARIFSISDSVKPIWPEPLTYRSKKIRETGAAC
jgi:hypothetical protein